MLHYEVYSWLSEERVQSKQAQQKFGHDKHAHPRELENGQNVMARNFRPGPDWVPGVVEGKCGPLSYVVKVGHGQMWKRHIDHIQQVSVVYPPTTDTNTLEPATGNTQEADQEVQKQPPDYAESRRYPVRYRQPPELYM